LFLHSGGGCRKTYLAKLITAGVCARDKIILCVASTGLAALLFPGGRTAHLHFKIPIPCHEQSICSIKKDDAIHQLLKETSFIIWDEAASQHHFIVETMDHTLCDLLDQLNHPFGGITILFGGDSRQTLPVILYGGREEIVPAIHIFNQKFSTLPIPLDFPFTSWSLKLVHHSCFCAIWIP
jgi:hypothetical protein